MLRWTSLADASWWGNLKFLWRLARETSAYDWTSRVESRIEPMSEAVNGGKNENKAKARKQEQVRSVAEIPPDAKAADQTSQCSHSGISALGLRGCL